MESAKAPTLPHLRDQPACERFFETEDLPRPLDGPSLLGPALPQGEAPPFEIEIGCGNGRYLRRGSAERPDHLFLGIERSIGYARRARDRMVKYGVGNARIACADATRLLASHVADGCVDAVHVYFTDPWPKTGHAKRRLFQTPFLLTLSRILRPGGRIFIKVDLFWYFEEIFCRFEASPNFRVTTSGTENDRARDLYDITAFEHKALRKKGAIFYLIAERA